MNPHPSPIKQQVVLVTGASTGIGRAIAARLAGAGFHVLAGVRQPAAERELAALGRAQLEPIRLDVTLPASIAAAIARVDALRARGAELRALVNNAAICVASPLEAVSLAELREHLEVNVLGVAAMTQAALPSLVAARGRIANIGSTIGRVAPPFLGPYALSKAALETMTDVMRRELSYASVQVSMIVPGVVMTPVWGKIAAGAAGAMARATPEVCARYEPALRRFVEQNHQTAVRSRQSADDVARVVERWLRARAPRRRYEVGFSVTAGSIASRLVPAALLDHAFRRLLRVSSGGAG